jgi:hypothetical protein
MKASPLVALDISDQSAVPGMVGCGLFGPVRSTFTTGSAGHASATANLKPNIPPGPLSGG